MGQKANLSASWTSRVGGGADDGTEGGVFHLSVDGGGAEEPGVIEQIEGFDLSGWMRGFFLTTVAGPMSDLQRLPSYVPADTQDLSLNEAIAPE
jgi:hypothetical protein